MSSDGAGIAPVAVRVENLAKRYRLGARQPYRRLGEALSRILLAPFGKRRKRQKREIFWALEDVSMTIREGEIVGIVGPNGAGKTTLLRILTKITLPTKGRAEIYGRVGSLLEVGTGFHPELTGRENVFLNGSILGMPRGEITRKYDEIVEFAQIQQFMDTPVKHYSSGMRVRLAFSVAAHLEPEILFIDEVLSVGDAAFQQKCLQKMQEVAGSGRTVLFVSHNMGAVTSLCSRVIWLEHGRVERDGDPQEVVEAYLSRGHGSDGRWEHPADARCGTEVQIQSVEVVARDGSVSPNVAFDDPVTIRLTYEARRPMHGVNFVARITDMSGTVILTSSNVDATPEGMNVEPGRYRYICEVPGSLLRPGRYLISVAASLKRLRLDVHEHCLSFEVVPIRYTLQERRQGVITPILPWRLEPLAEEASA